MVGARTALAVSPHAPLLHAQFFFLFKENVVSDNVNDGSTSTDVQAPTTLIERLANNKNENVVSDNVTDGWTESDVQAPTTLIERLANNKNDKKH